MRGATLTYNDEHINYNISTHTPHAGRDVLGLILWIMRKRFLLTRPMRGATSFLLLHIRTLRFLLTRPMRGATVRVCVRRAERQISTHTPHAGRDGIPFSSRVIMARFLLTRPMRGATKGTTRETSQTRNFYSHAPCGARPAICRPL